MSKPTKLVISLRTDDIKKHRYESIDDWQQPINLGDEVLFNAQTADMKNVDYNFLVLLHAMVEQYLCFRKDITDKQVTEFDMQHTHCTDPGSHAEAPYHKQHEMATVVETIAAGALGINMDEYEKAIDETLAQWKK